MKNKKTTKLIFLIVVAFIFFFIIYKQEKLDINEIDKSKIESFDLILSKGQSVQSKLISILNLSINDYSHIGIIEKVDGELFILHSTPDGTLANGIRYDDLQTFLDLSNVSDIVILRYMDISDEARLDLIEEVDRYKSTKRAFDYNFNNFNNDKIYCSELICLILNNSGIYKLDEYDLKKPIHPKYFLDKNGFASVNYKIDRP